ncbi:MAG: hypothetical protein J6X30_00530 [Clostridia bacterium]|nr:hypothetical protein [Clostridia bacterium]
MRDSSKHCLLKILRGAIDIIFALLLLTAVCCSYLEHGLFNIEAYQTAVFDDRFDSFVEKEITASVEGIGSVVEIPADVIIQAADMERMVTYAHDYTHVFLEKTINGKDVQIDDFASPELLEAVKTELDRYAAQENLTITQEDEEEIGAYILERINATLQYVPNRVYQEAEKLSAYLTRLSALKGLEVPLYGASILLLLVNFLIGGRRHTWNVMFGAAGTVWCAFATLFFPLLMLTIYDIPSRIALSESTLFCLLTGICRMIISRPALLFGLILTALTGWLVFACLEKARRAVKKQNKRHGFYRVHFSEESDEHQGHRNADDGNGTDAPRNS